MGRDEAAAGRFRQRVEVPAGATETMEGQERGPIALEAGVDWDRMTIEHFERLAPQAPGCPPRRVVRLLSSSAMNPTCIRLTHFVLLCLLLGAVTLSACTTRRGGGSSGDDDDSAAVDDDDDDDFVDDEVPMTEHCEPVSGWNDSWSVMEEMIVSLTNDVRAVGTYCYPPNGNAEWYNPVGSLAMQENLRCAARLHSVDMVDRNFFDHTNPDGLGPGERMSDAGYPWMSFGENIGWGYQTAEQMMVGWLESYGHCTNLMQDFHTEIGVGYFAGSGQITWTQKFGSR